MPWHDLKDLQPDVGAGRVAAYVARTEECHIDAGAERLAATKVLASGGAAPSVLALHGTGAKATRGRIRYLLEHLAEQRGLSSLCFDFSGHGESTGKLEQATLGLRREEAIAAAQLLDGQPPHAIVATSMGAHVAALLSPALSPRSLVFFCPAAYPEAAMDLRFGDGFSEVAKQPRAYVGSPAFQALRSFTGNLLIVAGKRDAVIPSEVIDLYLESAPLAKTTKVIWLDEAEHTIHAFLERHPTLRAAVLREVLATVDPS